MTRVVLSALAIERGIGRRWTSKYRLGTIIPWKRIASRRRPDLVRVLWDGTKYPMVYYAGFLEVVKNDE